MLPSLNKLDFSYFSIIYSSGSHVFELCMNERLRGSVSKGLKDYTNIEIIGYYSVSEFVTCAQ